MLKFFPRIYNDEILYSIFARYDVLNGNVSSGQVANELYGKEFCKYNIFYPMHLDSFIGQIPEELGITSGDLIRKNSIFPLFKPFMSSNRAIKVTNDICSGRSQWFSYQIPIDSKDIFNKNKQIIKICPHCFSEEFEKFGEAYAHRLHQIPANLICENHGVYLYEYPIPISRNGLFDINNIDISEIQVTKIEENLKRFYFDLFNDLNFLINGGYEIYDISKIQTIYRNKLRQEGYIQNINYFDKDKLVNDFINCYPEEFLTKLGCYFDKNDSDNWISNILKNGTEFIHPIKHLLFIRFLFGSADLIEYVKCEYKPFGDGPWPCLNHTADHYKELTIKSVCLKTHNKSDEPVGYFKCDCGFVYSRKGPDKSENDKYRIGRITKRGETWENKLRDLILNTNLSIKNIKTEMKCSAETVAKYAAKLGIYDELNTKMKYSPIKYKKVDVEKYKKEIVKFINDNPNSSRTKILSSLTKQYYYLNAYENDWLESILPQHLYKDGKVNYKGRNKEKWEELDEKTYTLVNEVIEEILNNEINRRITRTLISKKVNYSGLCVYSTLDRLPKTKKLLSEKCETLEQYHNRIQQKDIS